MLVQKQDNPGLDGFSGEQLTPEQILVCAVIAAMILGISVRLVRAMTKSGELPCVRVRRRVLYRVETLRRWAAEREVQQ